jgi:hypothetical protein
MPRIYDKNSINNWNNLHQKKSFNLMTIKTPKIWMT